MTLPTFEECFDKAKAGTATTLEKFIANFEPERDGDAEVFREQLAELVQTQNITFRQQDKNPTVFEGNLLRFFWNPATNHGNDLSKRTRLSII